MAGPDGGACVWEKAALPALSLGCTWEAPSSSCGDTHIQTYMPALVLTSIYIYICLFKNSTC